MCRRFSRCWRMVSWSSNPARRCCFSWRSSWRSPSKWRWPRLTPGCRRRRRGRRSEVGELGVLATPLPKLAAFFLFVALSSLGLPMLNGFVGEFLILLGTCHRHWGWAAWAALGVILSACYLLWSYQRVFFGDITREKNRTLLDASVREKWILATMAVVTLWMGIGSPFITRRTAAATQTVMDQVEPQHAYEAGARSRMRPQMKAASAPATNAAMRQAQTRQAATVQTISLERASIH